LGIKTLATLSTGVTFPNPQPYRQSQARLARLQKAASRKVKGSRNRQKANMKVAKQHAKTANIRKDTLNKLTTHLAKNHSQVVIEDLNPTFRTSILVQTVVHENSSVQRS
jgi:putative transposase